MYAYIYNTDHTRNKQPPASHCGSHLLALSRRVNAFLSICEPFSSFTVKEYEVNLYKEPKQHIMYTYTRKLTYLDSNVIVY